MKDNFYTYYSKNKIFTVLLIYIIIFLFSFVQNNKINNFGSFIDMSTSKKNIGDYNTPLQNFLEAITNSKNQTFCIKNIVGKPKKYRSYKCPRDMFILDFEEKNISCIKKCPKNMVLTSQYCETPCKEGYKKELEFCINIKDQDKKYKRITSPIIKREPLCINGYFLDGYCNSCMSHTDYSNENCLSPCDKGAILESFCAYDDFSNKKLSTMDHFWAIFIRDFYDELFSLFKKGPLNRKAYSKAKNLKEIAQIILKKKNKKFIQIDSGIVMIFIRDKFGNNLNEPNVFLRHIFMKMLSRYSSVDKENSKTLLNVVDDLMNFKGDYKSDYLNKKDYGILSLPLTVANFIDHLC